MVEPGRVGGFADAFDVLGRVAEQELVRRRRAPFAPPVEMLQ
jgi:hypothetical protein